MSTPEYTEIVYEIEGTTAVVTLNRPARLNAWTPTMEAEYRDALARADRDRGVRAVILTGAGRGFCAGADMGNLNRIADAGEIRRERRTVDWPPADLPDDFRQNHSFPLALRKPLIAAVNGPAVGLGFIHTLYCDIRFASDQARFGTAFASLGLVAEHGISWLLPRIVGISNALDLLFSARVIDAREALNVGLVNRVIPHDQLLASAREHAESLAGRSSPRSMAIMKRQVYEALSSTLTRAAQIGDEQMAASFHAPDFKEGLAAFAEKRPPHYQGVGA